MYRYAPLGFSSRDGQVESTPYVQSQQEIQQRQQAERTAQAEQAMMQAAREAQQQKESLERQTRMDADSQKEAQQRDGERQGRDRYVQELFRLTAPAATQHADTPHPELSGTTAGNIHSSASLMGRDWAAEQNAQMSKQQPTWIPQYNEDAPVIFYNTDMPTVSEEPSHFDMARTHRADNQVREFTGNLGDMNYGHIGGKQAQQLYDLPGKEPPTHISDVNLPIGTLVEASRPISGKAHQYKVGEEKQELNKEWFQNPRPLG